MAAQAKATGRYCCIQLSEYPAGHNLHCLFWKLLKHKKKKSTVSDTLESGREGKLGVGWNRAPDRREERGGEGDTRLLFYIKL